MKPITATKRNFRRRVGPLRLMNLGKFEAGDVATPGAAAALPTSGWHYEAVG